MKSRITAWAVSLLTATAGIVAIAAPAHAATPCVTNLQLLPDFCLYRTWNPNAYPYTLNFSESWNTDNPRNTCIPIDTYDDNAYHNGSGVRWYVFRTTACDGSHLEYPPNAEGPFPTGWNNGAVHAVMRTSSTS